MEILKCIEENTELRKVKVLEVDQEKLVEVQEKIYDLSSRYYEIIPKKEFRDSIISPLLYESTVQEECKMIESLLEVESVSKILLGAQSQ